MKVWVGLIIQGFYAGTTGYRWNTCMLFISPHMKYWLLFSSGNLSSSRATLIHLGLSASGFFESPKSRCLQAYKSIPASSNLYEYETTLPATSREVRCFQSDQVIYIFNFCVKLAKCSPLGKVWAKVFTLGQILWISQIFHFTMPQKYSESVKFK